MNEAVVVLAGAAARGGNRVFIAELDQMGIDELAPSVCLDPQDYTAIESVLLRRGGVLSVCLDLTSGVNSI